MTGTGEAAEGWGIDPDVDDPIRGDGTGEPLGLLAWPSTAGMAVYDPDSEDVS